MGAPPGRAPGTPSSSQPSRRRGGDDQQPPHPPEAASEALPGTASPPARRRGGEQQPPHPPEAASEALPGAASLPARRRGGDRNPPHPPEAASEVPSGAASPPARRRGGDRQPTPPPTRLPAAAAAVAGEGGVGPRRSFRISLRPRVRVAPWVKPPVARNPKDPAKPPRPSIEALAAEWAKEKAASGAPKEECVLPFLQKGAPRKVGELKLSNSFSSVRDCDAKLHKACSEKSDGCCPRHEAFRRLPLPYTFQEFNIDPIKKEELDNGTEPPPYTQYCGWGSRALEAIEKDDFVIEFVGEVIDDETCEERLEDMRRRGDKNFYMCKVKKDFVIDATFKGNDCRFFNHSCEPNCQLQKWQVNGKTRLGVFASKAIEVGEPLTYDYRFEQHYGPEIECFCGAQNCQGNMSVTKQSK
uniref:SET domain-containing protein n=1 Tax=Oryza punctata TaxID=4537 RepID=A0A0E0LVD0_ORYPU